MNIKPNFLDYVNCRILDVLSKNSSLPFVELAKQIGISDATIHTRVKKLLTLGIIKKFTIIVDNDLLGYDHLAFINLKIENGRTEETTKNLIEIDEILEIHEIYNKFDLMIKIRSKNLDDLRNTIVNRILSINYIKETELITVLRTRKEEQMISLNKEINQKTKEFF
ncbi:MAG TPA: Lrp/AsnC family transcriptional regulator [Nitrososphaeraceae archaeon]|nr:Lrp/AsnC family transcriptional regulator [Nitrososphaeraceae archaeon]